MTDVSNENMPPEPHDGIDAAAGQDAKAFERNQSNPLARASDGGPPPTEAVEPGELPERGGTGAGNPTAGVEISDEDLDEAVPGDTGPEHPGVRRQS